MFGLVPYRNRTLPPHDYFNRLMHGFFDDDFLRPLGDMPNAFRVDLRETEKEYIIEADLPGIRRNDINLHYENHYLTISAKRNDTQEVNEDNYVRKERHYGQFQRSIYVDNVLDEKIDAKFNDGVLTVTLPKQDTSKKQRGNIQIH
jgi:HSP20 family protein